MANVEEATPNQISKGQGGIARIWWIASLVILIVTLHRAYFNEILPINHDCAMYMDAGRLVLQGKIPYVDFIDLNPPLIFYLATVPVLLSSASQISFEHSFALTAWLAVFISWLLSGLLARYCPSSENRLVGPLLLAMAALSFSIGEWAEFGQRQHLAVLGMTPLIICRWVRYCNGNASESKIPAPLAGTTGLFAGLMLFLVPHYFVVPLAVEAYFQYKKRQLNTLFSQENLALFVTGVLYAGLILFMPNMAKDAFLHRWLPLVGQGYSAYNGDIWAFTTYPILIGSVPLILTGVCIAFKHRCSLTVPLLVWCGAAFVAVLIQQKGWYNHYLPMQAGAFLFAAVQVNCLIEQSVRKIPRWVAPVSVVLVLAICALPSSLFRQTFTYSQSQLQTIEKETKPGDQVMILSTGVPDIYPAILQANCVNGCRYLFLFPVEMLRYLETHGRTEAARENASKELDQVLTEIAEDISRARPKLILIPCGNDASEKAKSMVAYFQSKGLIDKFKSQYQDIGECLGRKNRFSVWKRLTSSDSIN